MVRGSDGNMRKCGADIYQQYERKKLINSVGKHFMSQPTPSTLFDHYECVMSDICDEVKHDLN